jgi:DNA-binding response OmpR family regulator
MTVSKSMRKPVESPARSLRVLVVEDCGESAQIAAKLLGMAGHEIQTARNGTEALMVAGTFHPQVVMIDIGLPGLDGLHVARQLRRVQPGVLLIATTGRSGPEAERSSAEAGFDCHMVKPLDFRRIVELFAAHDAGRDD